MTKPYGNIYFDTSGLADEEVIAEMGLAKIEKVLTLTASERPDNVVFGTDYAMCTIQKHIELVKALKLERLAKERIFSKKGIKLFHLKL